MNKFFYKTYYELGGIFDHKYIHRLMPQKFFLKVHWKKLMGYDLDLENTVTFNEKLQWLKIYYHNPLCSQIVDKEKFKIWAREKIGDEHIIKTYKVYKSANEIDLNELPQRFVLKCTHDSGSVLICKDKSDFDIKSAKKWLKRRINYNYYWNARELPYKNIKHRIIAEELISENQESDELLDYKFFCFSGEPKIMYVSNDHSDHAQTAFFDMAMKPIKLRMKDPNPIDYPTTVPFFKKMKELATILSNGFPFVRVDFYCPSGRIYVGEMTFFHGGGYSIITPKEWDIRMGEWIKLPIKSQ